MHKKFNIRPDDERRIKACIYYIMKVLCYNQGDTYLIYEEILRGVINYLNIIIDDSDFVVYLNELQLESKIIIEKDRYYLKELYDAEVNIVEKICILKRIPKTKYSKLDNHIELLEKENGIDIIKRQR